MTKGATRWKDGTPFGVVLHVAFEMDDQGWKLAFGTVPGSSRGHAGRSRPHVDRSQSPEAPFATPSADHAAASANAAAEALRGLFNGELDLAIDELAPLVDVADDTEPVIR